MLTPVNPCPSLMSVGLILPESKIKNFLRQGNVKGLLNVYIHIKKYGELKSKGDFEITFMVGRGVV